MEFPATRVPVHRHRTGSLKNSGRRPGPADRAIKLRQRGERPALLNPGHPFTPCLILIAKQNYGR